MAINIKATGTEVAGLAELGKALKAFPDKVMVNILRGAAFAGSKVIAAEVKTRAPVDTGGYRDAIMAKRGRGTRDEVVAGVTLSKANKKWPLWHLLEFGHAIRAARTTTNKFGRGAGKQTGAILGFVPAYPHFRPGLAAAELPALRTMAEYIRKRIDAETKKLARAAGSLKAG